MITYITPNDSGVISSTDSKSIQNAIDMAKAKGLNKVLIPRINARTGCARWDIDKAIILPSEIEIILDNCYLRQTDGSMDNVFRNFEDDAMRKTLAEEQHGIIIRGVGNAIIDGGIPNGLTQKTSMKDGFPHVEMNNVIRLHNLRDFVLEGFTIKNQRWWAVNLHYVESGRISKVDIVCDGKIHNQDGFDFRLGCNNIIIENCMGQAGDDFIALSAFLSTRTREKYAVEGKSHDIHNIIIKNIVATSSECTVVALRNQDGVKIHDITIDSIHDTVTSEASHEECRRTFNFDNDMYRLSKNPYSLIRLGQDGYMTEKSLAPGDIYAIHATNLHARTNAAILINVDLENSYFGNIYASSGCDRVVTTRSCRNHQTYGANMRRVMFENIFYTPDDDIDSVVFDFDENTASHALEGVVIKNAFITGEKKLLNMQHDGEIIMSEIYTDSIVDMITIKNGSSATINGKKYK